MNSEQLDGFDAWMAKAGYRDTTRRKYLVDVRFARHGDPYATSQLAKRLRPACRLYWRFLLDERPDEDAQDEALRAELHRIGARPARSAPIRASGRRLRDAVSFQVDDWRRLAQALLEDRTAEGRVLLVMVATGARVGDVLRTTPAALTQGRRTGALELERKGGTFVRLPWNRAWEALASAVPTESATVAAWVCPAGDGSPAAGGGAYQRVKRRLQALGADLRLSGRVHLHRLRRTVLVLVQEVTEDVRIVQEVGGLKSAASAARYTDEPRTQAVARVTEQLWEKHVEPRGPEASR